jgi:hypothetical protein
MPPQERLAGQARAMRVTFRDERPQAQKLDLLGQRGRRVQARVKVERGEGAPCVADPQPCLRLGDQRQLSVQRGRRGGHRARGRGRRRRRREGGRFETFARSFHRHRHRHRRRRVGLPGCHPVVIGCAARERARRCAHRQTTDGSGDRSGERRPIDGRR